MPTLLAHLDSRELAPAFNQAEASALATELSQLSHFEVFERSLVATQQTILFLGHQGATKALGCLTRDAAVANRFDGPTQSVTSEGTALTLVMAPLHAANAAALRTYLPFLVAQTLGLHKSAGCGDRLGLATPGHIRAFRST